MDDFIEQNKMALVEEMMESISAISSIIEDAITKEAGSADDIKNSFIAMSYKTGYLSAIFNQYYIFLTNRLPSKEKKGIGFASISSPAE